MSKRYFRRWILFGGKALRNERRNKAENEAGPAAIGTTRIMRGLRLTVKANFLHAATLIPFR